MYETVERFPSVGPSVFLSHRSTAAPACGGFATERRTGMRYRSTVAGAGAQQQRRSAANADSGGVEAGHTLVFISSLCKRTKKRHHEVILSPIRSLLPPESGAQYCD